MITFEFENKVAESVVAVLNATAGNATFLETLNEQFNAQFVPAAPVVEAVAEEAEAEPAIEAEPEVEPEVESDPVAEQE
jgi:hypothetical protein